MSTPLPSAKDIFLSAVEKTDPGARAEYVRSACGTDAELRQHVEALLRVHDEPDSLLDQERIEADVGDESGSSPTIDRTSLEQPGTQIGSYKLLQQIGEGGMGVVYLAEQLEPVKRRVALKIIKPGMDTRQVIARFEAERQALAVMDHPNIAKVLDAGTTSSGRPFFVMELVKGQPITQYCDEHQLAPRERLELFLPVCQAIQHAHQKGIIHRDIKPTNILVAEYDQHPAPKVIDFGVAKATSQALTEKSIFTGLGQIIGTLEYMSPEQANVNQLDIDTRSDIYSLGVLLYELLTGSTPFDKQRLRSAAFDEMLRIIREEEPPKPSTRLSSSQDSLPSISAQRQTEPAKLTRLVRGELDWIVMKALEKDRNRRYETASSLANDLQRYLADEPVQACPPSTSYRVSKFVRRNRGAVLAGLAIFLLLAISVIGTGFGLVRALNEAQEKERAWQAESIQKKLAQDNAATAKRQEAEALKQQREAEEQAAIAKAVTNFLTFDLLQQADIYSQEWTLEAPPDPDLKVRDALDRAAGRITGQFEKQPLVEAAIRYAMGATYRQIGEYTLAEEQLAAALRLRRQHLGAEHVETLKTLSQLGGLHFSAGHHARAEQELTPALEGLRMALGERDWATIDVMRTLARLYRMQGKYAQAEPLYQRFFEIERDAYGMEHRLTLLARRDIGGLRMDQGKYAEAEALLTGALEGERKVLGNEHPETLYTVYVFAELYSRQRQFSKAEPLYLQAVTGMRKVMGEQHPKTLSATLGLASVYQNQTKYAEAESLHLEAQAEIRRVFGDQHPKMLGSLNGLAWLYLHEQRYDKAEPLLLQVLDGRRKLMGAQHPSTLETMRGLARVYVNQARYAEAKAVLQEVAERQRTHLGEQHPETLLSVFTLAEVYVKEGKFSEAEPLFLQTWEAMRKVHGEQAPKTIQTVNALAWMYLKQEKYTQAETLLLQVLEGRRKIFGEQSAQTLDARCVLARLYGSQGRHAEAEETYRDVLATQRAIFGEGHAEVARTLFNIALLRRSQDKLTDAEALFREALAIQKKALGEENVEVAATLYSLAGVVRSQQKFPETEQLYRQTLAIRRKVMGPEHLNVADVLFNLATLLQSQERYGEVEPLVRECLDVRHKRLAAGNWMIADAKSLLGGALSGQGKYEEAEPLLLAGYQELLAQPPPPALARRTGDALNRIVKLYENWGKKDEAAHWRDKITSK